MALVKFGALLTDARGKIAGSVLSRNATGNVIRNKSLPRQFATNDQNSHKQLFAQIANDFKNLSLADKQGWIFATQYCQFFNKLGAQIPASPFWLFSQTMYNQYLKNGSYNTTFVEYVYPAVKEISSAVWDISSNLGTVHGIGDSTKVYVKIAMSRPFPPGKEAFYKNRCKQFYIRGPVQNSFTMFLTSEYTAKYPYIPPGWKFWMCIEWLQFNYQFGSSKSYFLGSIVP